MPQYNSTEVEDSPRAATNTPCKPFYLQRQVIKPVPAHSSAQIHKQHVQLLATYPRPTALGRGNEPATRLRPGSARAALNMWHGRGLPHLHSLFAITSMGYIRMGSRTGGKLRTLRQAHCEFWDRELGCKQRRAENSSVPCRTRTTSTP